MIIDFNAHFGCDPSMPATYSEAELMALLKTAGIDRAVVTKLQRNVSVPFRGGVRIYPTYANVGLVDEVLRGLAERTGANILQVYLRLQDPRVLPQAVSSAQVIEALDKLAPTHGDTRFVISGANYAETKANRGLFTRGNVWTDISHLQHPINSLPKLLDIVDSSRVLFGSNSPIFYPGMAVFRVIHSPISDEDRERILWKNARELLGDVQ